MNVEAPFQPDVDNYPDLWKFQTMPWVKTLNPKPNTQYAKPSTITPKP